MKGFFKQFLHIFLAIAMITLGISAILDFYLWYAIEYMIPSWTIGITALMCAMLCLVLMDIE